MTTFARYLQAQMDRRQWLPADLARAAGIAPKYISEYLNKGVLPKAATRRKIAQGLSVSVEEVNAAADGSPTHGVFELSPERQADAQALDRSQSELIYEMIRHLARGNRRQQGDSDEEFEVDKADRRNVERQQRRPSTTETGVTPVGMDVTYRAQDVETAAPEPATADNSEPEDYDLAASYGDEGIAPDELPEST